MMKPRRAPWARAAGLDAPGPVGARAAFGHSVCIEAGLAPVLSRLSARWRDFGRTQPWADGVAGKSRQAYNPHQSGCRTALAARPAPGRPHVHSHQRA